MAEKKTEILVIGGGPAGLAAAEAASSHGKRVTVIDENPQFGGQIWRAEKQQLSGKAKELVDSLDKNGVELIPSCTCVASLPGKRILALSGGKTFPITYDKVIIATGARERFVPFPGWTLPGVFGAGGLQALVKGGYDISGKRIIVAGTGPLLLAVAAYLKKKGGKVLVIADYSSLWRLSRLALAAVLVPGKFSEGMKLRKGIRGTTFKASSVVSKARGTEKLESVILKSRNRETVVHCDMLAVGFHLVPNTEVAELFNCEIQEYVIVDDLQRTSEKNVFCAGEPTGIGGLEKSLIEGKIAGSAAAGNSDRIHSFRHQRRKHERFASRLSALLPYFQPDFEKISAGDTIVCRCEDVVCSAVEEFDIREDVKLLSRAGMGSCQGRVCGTTGVGLMVRNSVRPPLIPLKISELANLETEKD